MIVPLGVGLQQCTRGAGSASCLVHRVHSSPLPYATDSSSGSHFLWGAGMNMLDLLIRDESTGSHISHTLASRRHYVHTS